MKLGRELHTNVEFNADVVMELPVEDKAASTTSRRSRVAGCSANFLEQARHSKVIHLAARDARAYVALLQARSP